MPLLAAPGPTLDVATDGCVGDSVVEGDAEDIGRGVTIVKENEGWNGLRTSSSAADKT